MLAAVATRYGPPGVVRVEDVPVPEPLEDDVLVRVHTSTVNRTDCHYRSGRPLAMHAVAGWTRPKVAILGTEYAGEVVEAGRAVTGWSPGDRVVGWIEGRFGAHAEYLAAKASGPMARVPADRPLDEAAALTEGTHYALNGLRKLGVGPGRRLLVYGATGSIGTAAVQLAKAMGARVTAVGSTGHLDLLRSIGADEVLDYLVDDVLGERGGYDAVFDTWGHASYFRLRALLRPAGRYCSTGAGAHKEMAPLALAAPLLRRRTVVFAYPRIDQAMVEGFAAQYASGAYRPVVDRRFKLEEIVDAYEYVEAGQKVGNVLLTVRATG